MERWVLIALVLTVAFVPSFISCSCDSGGGDDDDDDDCEPEDVAGSYAVTITWEEESCNEDIVGDSVSGTMTIEQDGKKATVFFQEFGSGTEPEKIFEGTVCEYTITGSKEEDNQIPGEDCSEHRQSTYTLQLDPDAQTLSGEFSGTYIWRGSDCDQHGIPTDEQCSWKRSVGPYTP